MNLGKKITVEVQYFHGCPHADEMIKRVREAITQSNLDVEFKKELVDTQEKADLHKFRGSPTVLVNGHDLEGLPAPDLGFLACRYYKNGIPALQSIINRIKDEAQKER